MKKLITLFFAITALVAVAQTKRGDEARRIIMANSTSASASPEQDRQAEIDRINKEYDQKIATIRNSPGALSKDQKESIIRKLEAERARKIDEVNRRYGVSSGSGSSSNGTSTSTSGEVKEKYKVKRKHHEDEDDDDEKVEGRKDNGKHLGWEKGVGNPHKNGGKPGKKKKG